MDDSKQAKRDEELREYQLGFQTIRNALEEKIFPNQLSILPPLPSWDVLVSLKSFDLGLSAELINYDLDIKAAAIFAVISGKGYPKIAGAFIHIYQITMPFALIERPIALAGHFIYGQITENSYKSMNCSMYSILATLDCRTCEKCGEMDGRHFRLEEAVVGETYPPFCDHCRCTTIAYFPEDNLREGTRWMRDPFTGKGDKVPSGTTYMQWHQLMENKYGAGIIEFARMKYINLLPDMAEQRTMAMVCGKDIPLKIADFQRIKYEDPEKWAELKEQYEYFEVIKKNTNFSDQEKRRMRKEYRLEHKK